MSLEREPSVTTLLRAAREADEQLLKLVLKKILIDGISKEALNSTDKSGRTAISYICSTNLTNFLDVLLQIPGIDVNKPDNEGNTPLHFAAQAGQTDALNMLLTRCRNLQLDAKNCLGFTPLMKAALQGRTRCAKLLLFAGASPMETDSGRGLTAEQWARFCGRESCADMLDNCTKARMLEKSSSLRDANNVQSKITLIRSKTNPCHSESFRSKFKKFLPFGFSIKDKQSSREVTKKERVSYLSRSTFCGSTPTISAAGRSQLLTTFVRPLEVPKLEVTPANNQHLIKKYEAKLASQTTRSSVIR